MRNQHKVILMLLCLALVGACTGERFTAGSEQVSAVDGRQMVYVPAGEFSMGSDREMVLYAESLCKDFRGEQATAVCKFSAFADEQPAHRVRLDGFWIDKTEVTNARYGRCVAQGVCLPPRLNSSFTRENYHDDPAYADYPVINVDWMMAAAYCEWAGGRLPSEAEWEYSARGPQSRLYPWGDAFERSALNYCDVDCDGFADADFDDGFAETSPVSAYPAGASWVGVLDLAGNVREWVSDTYGAYPSAVVENPTGPASGELRIPRGGSWYDTPDDVRSANRGGVPADYFRHNLGFRCAQNE